MLTEISLLASCIVSSMFFAGVETAMFGVGPLSLVRGNRKKLYWLYSRKERIVMTCSIGNNITIVGATILIENLLPSTEKVSTIIIVFGSEIVALFLFAEVFPKIIAQQLRFQVLEVLYYPINIFYYIFTPLSRMFSSLTSFFSGFLSISEKLKREDIFHFLSTQMHEQDITKGLMRLRTTNAKEIMTPLNKIYSISKNGSVAEIIDLLHQTAYSRYPVYEERGDQITGYVVISELLKSNRREKISNFVQKAEYIPEFLSVDQLLSRMQINKTPITFVVSELGSIIGLITLQDIAEELLGDIHSEEQPSLEMIKEARKGKNIFTLSGVLDIDDFNDYFGLTVKKDGFETLSGLLMKESMDIPQKNKELHFNFGSFKVLEGDQKNIKEVQFKKISGTSSQ